MPLQKPQRPKRKSAVAKPLNQTKGAEELGKLAEAVKYVGSPYHRLPGSPMGESASRTWPASNKCPAKWTFEAANRALKEAVRMGYISTEASNGFPRRIWYRDGETLYEARLSNAGSGEYHAYPFSSRQEWPKALKK
jgi:hypothetical protein